MNVQEWFDIEICAVCGGSVRFALSNLWRFYCRDHWEAVYDEANPKHLFLIDGLRV